MDDRVRRIFRDVWEFEPREPQLRATVAALEGKDVFVGIATGQGKSLCYQCIPLLFVRDPRIVVVVSPLRALISDQIERFERITGYKAAHLKTAVELRKFRDEPDTGVRLVFMAPEEMISADGRALLQSPPVPIALVAVDEAHCILEWGHDFRTSFGEIGTLRASMHGVPFMALTATATKKVQNEVTLKLKMKKKENGKEKTVIIRGSLDRPNIFLYRRKTTNLQKDLRPLMDALHHAEDPKNVDKYLVYTSTKKKLIDTWEALTKSCSTTTRGTVRTFHADMSPMAKEDILQGFRDGRVRVVVASVAFGMGIDIPDIKGVIIHGMPSTIGQLYQQIGRAGRRGEQSVAVVLHGATDVKTGADEGTKAFIKTDGCIRKELLHQLGEDKEEGGDLCCNICDEDSTILFQIDDVEDKKPGRKRTKPRPTRRKDTGNEDILKERLYDMRDEWYEQNEEYIFLGPCALMSDASIDSIVKNVYSMHTVEDLGKLKGIPEEKKETILHIIDSLIPEKEKPTTKRKKRNTPPVLRDRTNITV